MIYIVRQGQTDWNLYKKFNGITETDLNLRGIEQAKSLAEKLKDVDFDVCYCSPQKRTHQTCELIYKGKIIYDVRLIEIICGEFEGTKETAEAMKLFLEAIQYGDKGTETLESFIERSCNFCDMVTKKHKGQNVLIVTHSANARTINYYFNGKPKDYDFSISVIKNCEFLTFENK
jgi:probable phosphoglycerate mutase